MHTEYLLVLSCHAWDCRAIRHSWLCSSSRQRWCQVVVRSRARVHLRCCCCCLSCQVQYPPQGDAGEDAFWEPVLRRFPFPPADASRGTHRFGLSARGFALKALPIAIRDKNVERRWAFLQNDTTALGELRGVHLGLGRKRIWVRLACARLCISRHQCQMLVRPTKYFFS